MAWRMRSPSGSGPAAGAFHMPMWSPASLSASSLLASLTRMVPPDSVTVSLHSTTHRAASSGSVADGRSLTPSGPHSITCRGSRNAIRATSRSTRSAVTRVRSERACWSSETRAATLAFASSRAAFASADFGFAFG